MSSSAILSFVGGLEFDLFFRGLLSVLVGVVVLIGGSYLVLATNTGSRTGGMIAAAGFFGWMFLMGVVWTVYGIGWVGEAQSWNLAEISTSELDFAEDASIAELGVALGQNNDFFAAIDGPDADTRQNNALEFANNNIGQLNGWEYLVASNSRRGDAQSAAETFLLEENIFGDSGEYLPLQFGGFAIGGKPSGVDGDSLVTRFRKKSESILNPFHGSELVAIQVQSVLPQPTLPGQAPPIALADERANVVTVIVERDRGGPVPWLISGTRYVPASFAIFNGILFAIVVYLMHIRDRREMAVRAAVA